MPESRHRGHGAIVCTPDVTGRNLLLDTVLLTSAF